MNLFTASGIISSLIIAIVSYILVVIFARIIDINLEKRAKYMLWILFSIILTMLYMFIK